MSKEPDNEDKPHLTYGQIEALENRGKKLTGSKKEHWVDNRTICTTCSNAHIFRRYSTSARTIRCTVNGQYMPEDVKECSEYATINELSIHQMASIATLIGGLPERKVGFRKE